MHTVSIKKKQVARAVAAAVVALSATQAFGTGFQLNEQSASSMGNAFAAGAAFTDDASAMWWNPAALSQFSKPQVAAGLNIIVPSIKFSNNASQPAGCYPPACSPAVLQPLGNNGGDAGGYNYTPNISMVVPINQQWAFGLGINVPFGLVTEYDDGWIGRYQGLKSKIETLNVNPALSWKITPQFAVGVGVNYQQVKATLTQNVNYSGALLQAAAGAGVARGQLLEDHQQHEPGRQPEPAQDQRPAGCEVRPVRRDLPRGDPLERGRRHQRDAEQDEHHP